MIATKTEYLRFRCDIFVGDNLRRRKVEIGIYREFFHWPYLGVIFEVSLEIGDEHNLTVRSIVRATWFRLISRCAILAFLWRKDKTNNNCFPIYSISSPDKSRSTLSRLVLTQTLVVLDYHQIQWFLKYLDDEVCEFAVLNRCTMKWICQILPLLYFLKLLIVHQKSKLKLFHRCFSLLHCELSKSQA